MTIQELIEKLENYPQDLDIEFGCDIADVGINPIYITKRNYCNVERVGNILEFHVW